jgi:hypothetical protein
MTDRVLPKDFAPVLPARLALLPVLMGLRRSLLHHRPKRTSRAVEGSSITTAKVAPGLEDGVNTKSAGATTTTTSDNTTDLARVSFVDLFASTAIHEGVPHEALPKRVNILASAC